MDRLRFCEGDLDSADVRELLAEHLAGMVGHSPPESIHALPIDALREPDITFWSARSGEVLLGMGALREIGPDHGEIKSMRTVVAHRRNGVGARILGHLVEVARGRGYRRLSLETGTADFFAPARTLYAAYGFVPCGPFTGYVEDRYSCFMTRELAD